MEATGRVVERQGSLAVVEVKRTSACEGCHKTAEGDCSVCTLMGGESSRVTRTVVQDPIGAVVGDMVRIESPARNVLLWAAAVFLLPLLAAAGGFAIVQGLSQEPVWQAAGAGVGLLLCFLGLRVASARMKKRMPDAVITEIICTKND